MSPTPGTVFDLYIMVDWSANSRPKTGKDSVWVGSAQRGRLEQVETINPATRHAAVGLIRERLRSACQRALAVLVGFDFPFGYPRGFADRLGLPGESSWRQIWREFSRLVQDGPRNENNRWLVASELNRTVSGSRAPFWGCDARFARDPRIRPHLSTRKEDAGYAGLPKLRYTEERFRRGRARVHEVWKLWTSGSVGSQALLGLPYLESLRSDPVLEPVTRVWPFETGFTPTPTLPAGPFVVLAEIWPGIVEQEVRAARAGDPGSVRDRVQVLEMCKWATRHDVNGVLRAGFAPPAGLDAEQRRVCVREEGWILGGNRLESGSC